jgi:hypothetical protein
VSISMRRMWICCSSTLTIPDDVSYVMRDCKKKGIMFRYERHDERVQMAEKKQGAVIKRGIKKKVNARGCV